MDSLFCRVGNVELPPSSEALPDASVGPKRADQLPMSLAHGFHVLQTHGRQVWQSLLEMGELVRDPQCLHRLDQGLDRGVDVSKDERAEIHALLLAVAFAMYDPHLFNERAFPRLARAWSEDDTKSGVRDQGAIRLQAPYKPVDLANAASPLFSYPLLDIAYLATAV